MCVYSTMPQSEQTFVEISSLFLPSREFRALNSDYQDFRAWSPTEPAWFTLVHWGLLASAVVSGLGVTVLFLGISKNLSELARSSALHILGQANQVPKRRTAYGLERRWFKGEQPLIRQRHWGRFLCAAHQDEQPGLVTAEPFLQLLVDFWGGVVSSLRWPGI